MSEATDNARAARKSRQAFRTISEVADDLGLPQHVLRFWETKFSQIKPMKRGGNRRYYRPDDVELLRTIKQLLHSDGYTIRGVQKLFREQGVKQTVAAILSGEPAAHSTIDAPEQSPAEVPEAAALDEGIAEAEAALTSTPDTALKNEINTVLADLKALRERLAESL